MADDIQYIIKHIRGLHTINYPYQRFAYNIISYISDVCLA